MTASGVDRSILDPIKFYAELGAIQLGHAVHTRVSCPLYYWLVLSAVGMPLVTFSTPGQHARNVIIRGGDQGMPSTHRGRSVTKNQFLIIAYRPISLFNVAAATSAAFLEASRV